MTDLSNYLLNEDAPDLGESPETYRIGGDKEATWALRKIAQAEAEIARIRQQAIAETTRINEWGAAAERGPQSTVDFFTGKLIEYRRLLEDANPHLPQTYKVVGGRIARRKGRASTKVTEPDLFVKWAQQNAPDAVKVTPLVSALASWKRTDAGELVSPDGETVPGVQEVRSDDVYQVKAEAETASPF